MAKIPVATTIPLQPYEGDNFYAVVIPEQYGKDTTYALWIFRQQCGTSLCYSSRKAKYADETMSSDGIKALDITGQYDEIKSMLIDMD